MRLVLWLLFRFLALYGLRVVGMTIDGRKGYDRMRVSTRGTLEAATDGLSFKWNGCRVGYEPSDEDLKTATDDNEFCAWCGEEWRHSLPNRLPRDRCEACARHTAQVRGVPWETVR